MLLVGHVTKDGSIAGPRVLEHLVDVVIAFEGERHSRLRLVRAVKNRYGPTDEVGCFDLSDAGLVGLPDPSGLFLSRRRRGLPRHLPDRHPGGPPPAGRRGPGAGRAQPAAEPPAAGDQRARHRPAGDDPGRPRPPGRDHHAAHRTTSTSSTVGGVRLTEPAADLALALAVASATVDRPLVPGTVAFGEVGLAGEVRPVAGVTRRLAEASRLGFPHAIVPPGTSARPDCPRACA